MFYYKNNALFALFLISMLLTCDIFFNFYCFVLLLCFCLFALMWCKETQTVCCLSWLQYRICHSLSTIQYVLVPQVQRLLQAAGLREARSQPASRSGSRSGSGALLKLWRGSRNRQEAGPPQDELRDSQCKDCREAHTYQGDKEISISFNGFISVSKCLLSNL